MLAGRSPSRRVAASTPPDAPGRCRLCASETEAAGVVTGRYAKRAFHLRRCGACGLAFVSDPLADLASVYDDAYYEGRGADPLVNYAEELNNPETVRRFEWRGILAWARSLMPIDASTRWLDYGCGAGGLVAALVAAGVEGAAGFEPGVGARRFRAAAPERFLEADTLGAHAGSFDVLSAIEVLEHLLDPVAELKRMRQLLRPGGLLLLTTGNAEPYRERLTHWRYVVPEVHISFFEPRALARALHAAGFTPAFPGFTDGWADIYRFKVEKQLRLARPNALEQLVPWGPLARALDRRLRLSAQPIGWATNEHPPGSS